MFLDGMGDQLSWWKEENNAGEGDHAEEIHWMGSRRPVSGRADGRRSEELGVPAAARGGQRVSPELRRRGAGVRRRRSRSAAAVARRERRMKRGVRWDGQAPGDAGEASVPAQRSDQGARKAR
jgi:hypothetical protein